MQLFDRLKQPKGYQVQESKAFASGGEGWVCEHPQDKSKVIKIYHKERDLKLENALIELQKLPSEFIKPVEIFYTQAGKIAGFSMNYINMNKYVILKKIFNNTFCLQNGFDKKVKFKIYQNLKKAVEQAHSVGITIGDLNPYNILVNNQGEVVMIDVDSFGTKSKPHNGVLLEDIRDWLYHPKIDENSDKYAFDVLTFWMFTFLHPFRGDYPQHKTLEERVCKKSSVLASLPITIPKCYQPFQNKGMVDQFFKIFQNGERFLVDLTGQPQQILQVQTISQPDSIESNSLYIRKIADGIDKVKISKNNLVYLKNGIWNVISVKDFGIYNQLYTISDAENVFVGDDNVVYLKNNYLFNKGNQIKNVSNAHGLNMFSDNNSIFSTSDVLNKYELHSVDDILNDSILSCQSEIYIKSLQYGDGAFWQQIGNNKWLVDCNKNQFNLIKTKFNIKNAYKRNGYVLIEHLDNNKTRYTICKINGLNLEIGCDIPEWRYFDVKQGFIFIPEDGKINLINPINNWKMVSTIECPIASFDSKIFHTNSGMIIQTEDSIYLINKK